MSNNKPRKRRVRPVKNVFGRRVGEIDGDTLKIYASTERHMLRQPRGWAIQKTILEQAKKAKVKSVEILDQDAGIVYVAPLMSFWSVGIFVDRGFGEQWCLPVDQWKRINQETIQ
jgi:hypothetical protein